MMQKIKFNISAMLRDDVVTVAELEKLYFSKPWSKDVISFELNNPNAHFIVAKSGKLVIGYAGMYHVCKEGYIYNIAVHHNFRNMKVGQSLLAQLDVYAKNKDLNFISLEVRESNQAAIRLYTICGFEVAGIRRKFYENPSENGIIMTKYLQKSFLTYTKHNDIMP